MKPDSFPTPSLSREDGSPKQEKLPSMPNVEPGSPGREREALVAKTKELANVWTDFERKAARLETASSIGFKVRELIGDIAKYGRRGGAVNEYLTDADSIIRDVHAGEGVQPGRAHEIQAKFIRDEGLPIIQGLISSLMDGDPHSGEKIDFRPASRFLAFMRESLKTIEVELNGGTGIGDSARKHGATDAERSPGASEAMDGLWADYKRISDIIIDLQQLTK